MNVSQLDLDTLPRHQERRFVPLPANLTNREEVVSLYQELLDQEIHSAADLEKWLLDRSELEAALDQQGSILYIKMTCQTDNPVYTQEYKNFIETIVPAVKPLEDRLNRKYLDVQKKFPLGKDSAKRYEVYDRVLRSDVEIFREANVPLSTQIQLLSQEYQTICGAMTVQFQGQERTLPQMSKFFEDPDRSIREEAWQRVAQRRLQDKEQLNTLFDQMLKLRNQTALNAGYKNFAEYQFKASHRFDYTAKECRDYHQAVEECVVPVLEKIYTRRRQQMKLSALRPWDTAVDPLGLPPLKPFEKVDDLISGANDIFVRIDSQLGGQFGEMREMGLLDLDNRKGKAPGGYQSALAETRRPFIFMNAVGVDDDVFTLLHEGGHAFHVFACDDQPLYYYRHAPLEFCEVASMSMELLGGEFLNIFYSPEDVRRSRFAHLEGIIQLLAWIATIDAFQFWIYEHPAHSSVDRENAWVEINQRFSGRLIDWSGLESLRANLWHRQLHIFEAPFYYIEYGIAQLGALQLWLKAKTDRPGTIADYRRALSLGGSRPLPELFAAAGLKFDFSRNTIQPLVEAVKQDIGLK